MNKAMGLVCWVLPDIGFYHHVRLEAAACESDLKVCALELHGQSGFKEFKWQPTGSFSYQVVSLPSAQDSRNSTVAASGPKKLSAALSAIDPDFVAVPGWSGREAIAAMQWCVAHRRPAILLSESTGWDEARSGWKEWVKKRVIALCSSALAGGTAHADYLADLGMPRDRIFLGYDAIDNDYFAKGAATARTQRAQLSSIFQLPSSPFFLASARFIEKKNLPRLLQAYGRYREIHQKSEVRSQESESKNTNSSKAWDLVLLGDGPLRSDLCSLISDLRLQHSVLLPGFKQYTDLPAYYGLASAFIHASTTEQWGLVVNEAMASDLPILVSNRCGCAKDLVRESGNGFTFDPENVEQLAQLMLRLAASPSPRLADMGDASRQIISNWGPDRFATGLKQAVKCALKVGPKRVSCLERLLLRTLLAR